MRTHVLAIVIAVLPIASPAHAQPAGAVGVWSFDALSGTVAADLSGNGRDATLAGDAAFGCGHAERGLVLDGLGDEATAARPALGNEVTVMGWFYARGAPGPGSAVTLARTPDNAFSWSFLLHPNDVGAAGYTFGFYVNNGGVTVGAGPTPAIPLRQWAHVAAVASGSRIAIYLDGVLADEHAIAMSQIREIAGALVHIGADGRYTDRFFNGLIDDVALYARALSGAEIHDHHALGLRGVGFALPADTTAPFVEASAPFDGATEVAPTTSLRVTFSEPMQQASAGFALAPAVPGAVAWDACTLIFAPAAPLARSAQYTMSVAGAAADLGGLTLGAPFAAGFVTAAGYVPPPIGPGTLAAWSFDEGSDSVAADGSSNGRDAALQGDAGWESGKSGTALALDGSGAFAQASPPPLGNTLTVAGWFLARGTPGPGSAVTLGTPPDIASNWSFLLHPNELGPGAYNFDFYVNNGGQTETARPGPTWGFDTWHHVAATASGAATALYADGALADTRPISMSQIREVGGGHVQIGSDARYTDRFFDGLIDDVRILDHAASLAAVSELYAGLPDTGSSDADGDGVDDDADNCVSAPNADQADLDGDGDGDACDSDDDGDGVLDPADACPAVDATDSDADFDGCVDAVNELAAVVSDLGLAPSVAGPLTSTASAASASAARGSTGAAANQLRAFIRQVAAQTGKKLSAAHAGVLVAFAENALAGL